MEPPLLTPEAAAGWFDDQVADDWFTGPVRATVDRDEVMITGTIPAPDAAGDEDPDDDGAGGRALAEHVAISEFREATRDARIEIARRAEAAFHRKVSWSVVCGTTRALFTNVSIPVMTRLRIDERQVLDTLVGAGVARSRSDALGWCVRLVAERQADWLGELRSAIDAVNEVRSQGPDAA